MDTTKKRTRIAVTAGDPFGIGPEVALAAAAQFPDEAITLYGDPQQLAAHKNVVAVPVLGERTATPGPSAAGGAAALDALNQAMADLRDKKQDVLVTAPMSKESCALSGRVVDGHTGVLGRFFDVAEPLMAFVWDEAEPVVALLTVHVPLKSVAHSLTSAKVERAVRLLHESLATRFRRERARIGVLGLNPHAGERGLMGTEESDHIEPAIRRLRADGLDVVGPIPGDTAFVDRTRFDGLLAMYHDQALAPVKALGFHEAVNVTLGLPIVRTSPAHGTAFDIAGKNEANPASMTAAIRWALHLGQ